MVAIRALELNTPQNYNFLGIYANKLSQKHFHSVNLEDADITDLADLSGRKEFDAASAVAKIIAK